MPPAFFKELPPPQRHPPVGSPAENRNINAVIFYIYIILRSVWGGWLNRCSGGWQIFDSPESSQHMMSCKDGFNGHVSDISCSWFPYILSLYLWFLLPVYNSVGNTVALCTCKWEQTGLQTCLRSDAIDPVECQPRSCFVWFCPTVPSIPITFTHHVNRWGSSTVPIS